MVSDLFEASRWEPVDVGGLTAEFNKKMRAIQAEMTANPDSANQKQGEMMALMSTLDFRSASIGFEDDSLTGKLVASSGRFIGVRTGRPSSVTECPPSPSATPAVL